MEYPTLNKICTKLPTLRQHIIHLYISRMYAQANSVDPWKAKGLLLHPRVKRKREMGRERRGGWRERDREGEMLSCACCRGDQGV